MYAHLQKIYFLLAIIILVFFVSCVLVAVTEEEVVVREGEVTTLEIKADSIVLGNVKWGYRKRATFYLKNTGNSPLVVKEAKAVCGCTEVIWDSKPVRPGGLARISFIFQATSQGEFVKIIDVSCNTLEEKYKLKIAGYVSTPDFK